MNISREIKKKKMIFWIEGNPIYRGIKKIQIVNSKNKSLEHNKFSISLLVNIDNEYLIYLFEDQETLGKINKKSQF